MFLSPWMAQEQKSNKVWDRHQSSSNLDEPFFLMSFLIMCRRVWRANSLWGNFVDSPTLLWMYWTFSLVLGPFFFHPILKRISIWHQKHVEQLLLRNFHFEFQICGKTTCSRSFVLETDTVRFPSYFSEDTRFLCNSTKEKQIAIPTANASPTWEEKNYQFIHKLC